jgi:hypothetical protein
MNRRMQTRQQIRACLRRRTHLQIAAVAFFLGLPVLVISFFISLEIWDCCKTSIRQDRNHTVNADGAPPRTR